ncbi:hypothetical protein PV10_04240 [Exophiala mesophila]|uniref:Succinate dehydrogenase assembly factor 2, mitochondrial n=1 Tax=Exophiala mesophila TaxID=212818 RepID=A0A0D1ZE79_EXOME|nr:uncharacterized protein PV10_04240 [Exophiala mesophila]KIV92992.1 hypothetical protein PV10_04240 [Exophiala mesophila]
MNPTRVLQRSLARSSLGSSIARRGISTSTARFNDRVHSNAAEYRKDQTEKADNPHMTNTNSAITNDMPSVGSDSAPPEFLSSVDPKFVPQDKHPENTKRMTGGTQESNPDKVSQSEFGVGEMEGISFRVEPLKRTGEDVTTMRARLLYQSRKRGTLESDLLLSTFAAANLSNMNKEQLQQYDAFLDENDWDIYYWATQSPAGSPTSLETAEGSVQNKPNTTQESSSTPAQTQQTDAWRQGAPRSGEWAQTVGAFKPAYRPVPQRWKESEILKLVRKHVKDRSAGGVLNIGASDKNAGGGGLGKMPEVQTFE